MSINFYGDARGEFRNTVVGEHATMTVYESADVREELDALLAAIRAERDLPPGVATAAEEARRELERPQPRRDRIADAMERIRQAATSATAVAGAATAVLRALGAA